MSRPAGAAATVAAPYVTINDETVNNCIASDIVTPSRSGRQATDQVFSLVVPDRPKRDPGYPRHGSVQNVLIMDAAATLSPGAFTANTRAKCGVPLVRPVISWLRLAASTVVWRLDWLNV